ncbi:hypothetical protein J2Y03_004795 [Neobacillus niacini]|uniref:hypothetical protein n=1 Tax=Neobacillus niacini TaxID=86668 RepID=UPI002856C4B4|nr:hypothetical protein [Neobacillus niacini]MDR7079737.1 hypothetical protein [Neobacillus niacini]
MSKLEHLTEEQLERLINEYYEGANIKQLITKFEIKLIPSRLVQEFPPVVLEAECIYCGTKLIQTYQSRNTSNILSSPICPNCGHQKEEFCPCNTCNEYRKLKLEWENKRKSNLILNIYLPNEETMFPEEELTLIELLYLAVLLRAGLDESMEYILPVKEYKNKLGPTDDIQNEIVLSLTNRQIIRPHISSPISAFKDDENFPSTYYVYHVRYALNIKPIDSDIKSLIHRLMHPVSDIFIKDKDFCFEMWKKISQGEVLEYLLYSMEKVKFSFSPGEKTLAVIDGLLESFSVSQIYNIIYRSIANATKYYQETGISRNHAANLVVTNCQRSGEKAIAEGWKIKPYGRDFYCPQSILSELFFNRILNIGILGFDLPPTIDI